MKGFASQWPQVKSQSKLLDLNLWLFLGNNRTSKFDRNRLQAFIAKSVKIKISVTLFCQQWIWRGMCYLNGACHKLWAMSARLRKQQNTLSADRSKQSFTNVGASLHELMLCQRGRCRSSVRDWNRTETSTRNDHYELMWLVWYFIRDGERRKFVFVSQSCTQLHSGLFRTPSATDGSFTN